MSDARPRTLLDNAANDGRLSPPAWAACMSCNCILELLVVAIFIAGLYVQLPSN